MRIDRIDFYKGLLMIGVVWGHAISVIDYTEHECAIYTFFRTYDMPFFMFLSGIFLARSIEKYDLKRLLINKVATLLVPVVLWSLVRSLGTSLGGYYFIWAIFLSSAIVITTHWLTKNALLRALCYIAPIVVLHCIDAGVFNMAYLYPFFLIGFLFFEPSFALRQPYKVALPGKWLEYANILLFVVMLCFWSLDYNPWDTRFNLLANPGLIPITLFRFAIGLSGIFAMRWVFDRLYHPFVRPFVCRIGRKTLGVYLLQGLLVETLLFECCWQLAVSYDYATQIDLTLLCYVVAPLVALITCWFSLLCLRVLESNKYTAWTVGK